MPVATPTGPASSWPLIGREDELAAVHEALAGEQRGIVLSGPAGVGKTRLAREALAIAAGADAVVHWVLATQATSALPFSAVAHLLPASAAGSPDPLSMFQSVAGALRAETTGRRLVLAVDDAHLLDDGSAGLVLHLAASGAAFVVATLRVGERCPDPVVALWKDELATRLELQALSRDEVGRVLQAVLGGSIEKATLWRLFDVTQGNPLFLHELVRSARTTGSLLHVDGLWRWDGSVLFPGLSDLVARRLDGLPEGERQVVELVAVGEPLPVRLIAGCTSEADLLSAERDALLTLDASAAGEQLVRLVHPLYGEVLRAGMGPLLRRSRYGALCQVLSETTSRTGEDNGLRLASWSLEAGVPVDVEVLVEAAWAAHAVFDHPTAVRLAQAALLDERAGIEAVLALAAALRGMNRTREACDLLAEREQQAQGSDAASRYVTARAEVLSSALGSSAALVFLERAVRWRDDVAWRQLVTVLTLPPLIADGRYRQVVASGAGLPDDPSVEPATRVRAALSVGLALAEVGEVAAAVALADRATALAADGIEDFPRALQQLTQIRVVAAWTQGQWAELEPLITWYYDEGNRLHDRSILGPASYVLGLVHVASGTVGSGALWLAEAVGHLETADSAGYLSACLARLAHAIALTGDARSAQTYLDRARATAERRPAEWLDVMETGAAQAWLLAAAGDVTGARRAALDLAARMTEQPHNEALFLHDALRLGEPATNVVERLELLQAAVDSPLVAAFAGHAAALVARNGRELERVVEQLAGFPALLLAAEVAVEAAEAHRREGDPRAARRAAARAEALVAQCEGARTPALIARTTPGLTPREREVAALAADGLTSAAIAERLFVSERTVESHLYRACDKLGVHGRDELRSVLA